MYLESKDLNPEYTWEFNGSKATDQVGPKGRDRVITSWYQSMLDSRIRVGLCVHHTSGFESHGKVG